MVAARFKILRESLTSPCHDLSGAVTEEGEHSSGMYCTSACMCATEDGGRNLDHP